MEEKNKREGKKIAEIYNCLDSFICTVMEFSLKNKGKEWGRERNQKERERKGLNNMEATYK